MKISNIFLALAGATLLSANALAETQAPSLVAYDVNGDGTIAEGEKAYELKSADDLYWFANYVNDMANAEEGNVIYYSSANAVLTANITVNENLLSRLVKDNDGNVTNGDDFKAWNPIGFYYNYDWNVYYAGTFDGNGYTISGLYFNNGNQGYVGLIGLTTEGAVIKNVGVIDSYFKGESNIGGVCGDNYYGTIEKCYNTGKVEGSNNIGGVCGFNYYGTIENCYNSGEISGGDESSYIGGVYGFSYGTIKNCYDFKLNSGTLSEYSIVVENNTIALPTEDMVSREGYQFGGWYDNTDCEGDGITSEVEFNDVHTLYAKWTGGSTPTAIKAVEAESNKTIKTIKDGQIVIIRNGVMYDMQGHKLE